MFTNHHPEQQPRASASAGAGPDNAGGLTLFIPPRPPDFLEMITMGKRVIVKPFR